MLQITATVNSSGDYTNIAEITAVEATDPDSQPDNRSTLPNEDDTASLTVTPVILPFDYSDAPTTGTSYGSPGHAVVSGVHLGTLIDAESSGFDTVGADGDDTDGSDDEDGVTIPTLTQGETATITVTVAGAGGFLQGWIDFDGNGSFDADEQIATDLQDGGGLDTDATAGVIAFDVAVPVTAVTTQTYTRFRWSTTAGLNATDLIGDGEVEDDTLTIEVAPAPFACDNSIYQLADTPNTLLRRVTFSASGASFTDLGSAGMQVDAGWGYNELDNFIYGIRTGTQNLYQVDAAGVFTNLGPVTGMGADTGDEVGDVDPSGILILRSSSNTYYRVDLTTQPYAVVGSFTISGAAAGLAFADIAYNAGDGLLYGVSNHAVYSINPVTGASLGVMSTSFGFQDASAAWFDDAGVFYGYDNSADTYYAMNLTTQQIAQLGVSDTDEGGNNDGASCRGPRPAPLGSATGTVYEDSDKSDTYDVGIEPPLANITVNIYEENGTPGNTGDDTLISTAVTDVNGFYTLALILAFAGNTYRIQVDTADTDLPSGATIGTTNPLTTVTVTDGGTTANQDFSFDFGVAVKGIVYEDTQPNGTLDSGETGTGESLFVKLLSRTGTTCSAPALQAVAATPTTGDFAFSDVAVGDYCLIVDTNNTLSDTVPTPPNGWILTSPSAGLRHLSVASQTIPNQLFGLYHGSQLSGTVFQDTGNSGGTANDGIQNGTETGINNVTLTLTDCASTVHSTATTSASGAYTLYIPSTVANGAALCAIETNASSDRSTGASVGTTSGSYNRTSDTIQFTYSSGTSYSGVDFGDVPPNQWLTDGQQNGLPGTVVWYSPLYRTKNKLLKNMV